MSSEWLAARPFVPRPAAIFPRPRLFEKLDAILADAAMVWISAPVGSGKTSLVSAYLQARDLPGLWYRIEREDPDSRTTAQPAATAAGDKDPVAAHLRLPRIFRALDPGTLLVVDDWPATADPESVGALRTAPRALPQGSKLLVISREDPPAALARLRVHGVLFVLAAEDLRLTLDEPGTCRRTKRDGARRGGRVRAGCGRGGHGTGLAARGLQFRSSKYGTAGPDFRISS